MRPGADRRRDDLPPPRHARHASTTGARRSACRTCSPPRSTISIPDSSSSTPPPQGLGVAFMLESHLYGSARPPAGAAVRYEVESPYSYWFACRRSALKRRPSNLPRLAVRQAVEEEEALQVAFRKTRPSSRRVPDLGETRRALFDPRSRILPGRRSAFSAATAAASTLPAAKKKKNSGAAVIFVHHPANHHRLVPRQPRAAPRDDGSQPGRHLLRQLPVWASGHLERWSGSGPAEAEHDFGFASFPRAAPARARGHRPWPRKRRRWQGRAWKAGRRGASRMKRRRSSIGGRRQWAQSPRAIGR